jgi:hypothetical protein
MSRVIRYDQFLPVEKSKFKAALESAGIDPAQFDVSKMEISPPLMPGNITALVTVKLAAGAIAFSYEDASGSSWVSAFEEDLAAGRFSGQERASGAASDTVPLRAGHVRQGAQLEPHAFHGVTVLPPQFEEAAVVVGFQPALRILQAQQLLVPQEVHQPVVHHEDFHHVARQLGEPALLDVARLLQRRGRLLAFALEEGGAALGRHPFRVAVQRLQQVERLEPAHLAQAQAACDGGARQGDRDQRDHEPERQVDDVRHVGARVRPRGARWTWPPPSCSQRAPPSSPRLSWPAAIRRPCPPAGCA